MLDLRNVTKRFGRFEALHDVGLQVRRGEVVALVGANGAGKSTLIKILAGLYADAFYSGEIDGRALDLSSPNAARRAGIGVVHQEIDLVPHFTVAENVLLGREPTRGQGVKLLRKRDLLARATALLAELKLDRLPADAIVSDLSIEMRQITLIVQVVALGAELVVFDEPTARLSTEGRKNLFALIRQMRDAGKMIVFVSHYLEEVFELADIVVVLRDGRKVGEHRRGEIDLPGLIKAMVGDVAQTPPSETIEGGETVMAVARLSCAPHFSDVSFALRASEVLGITGLVGSGRQELMRALIGQRDAEGSVKVLGKEFSRASVSDIVGKHLGFVPEDRKREGVFNEMSVGLNLALPWLKQMSTAGVVRRSRVAERARKSIDRLRLVCSSASQPVRELSGGNQQKAVLGRWLDPSLAVVLMESPTVGVDVAGKEEIRRVVRSLAAAGKGVIISSDDPWELQKLTDRMVVMVRGRIVGEMATRLTRDEELLAVLTGAAGLRRRHGRRDIGLPSAPEEDERVRHV